MAATASADGHCRVVSAALLCTPRGSRAEPRGGSLSEAAGPPRGRPDVAAFLRAQPGRSSVDIKDKFRNLKKKHNPPGA